MSCCFVTESQSSTLNSQIMSFLALKRLKFENWGISPGEYPPVYPSFRTNCAVLHFDLSQASENLMDYQKGKKKSGNLNTEHVSNIDLPSRVIFA